MSTHTENQSSRERSWIYITACVLLAGAAIVAVLLFEDVRESNRAQDRADELITMLTNGAAGPGTRPVIADSRAVQGQLLIMEVYCPDELDEFREFAEDLKTDEHVSD